MNSRSFERIAGAFAFVAAPGGVAYSVAFVIFLKTGSTAAAKLASVLLLLGGVVAIVVIVGLYGRIRESEPSAALLALVLGVAAGVGSAIHGGYDLANFTHPPTAAPTDLPNAIDPRGLMTFAFSGLAIITASWVIVTGGRLPKRLGSLGLLGGVLLVLVYLGRLIILNPKSPGVLVAAVLGGFLVIPAWYVWLGMELRRGAPA